MAANDLAHDYELVDLTTPYAGRLVERVVDFDTRDATIDPFDAAANWAGYGIEKSVWFRVHVDPACPWVEFDLRHMTDPRIEFEVWQPSSDARWDYDSGSGYGSMPQQDSLFYNPLYMSICQHRLARIDRGPSVTNRGDYLVRVGWSPRDPTAHEYAGGPLGGGWDYSKSSSSDPTAPQGYEGTLIVRAPATAPASTITASGNDDFANAVQVPAPSGVVSVQTSLSAATVEAGELYKPAPAPTLTLLPAPPTTEVAGVLGFNQHAVDPATNRVWFGGGYGTETELWYFDPAGGGSWGVAPSPIPRHRRGSVTIVRNGKVYLFFGRETSLQVSDVNAFPHFADVYDIAAGTWSTTSECPRTWVQPSNWTGWADGADAGVAVGCLGATGRYGYFVLDYVNAGDGRPWRFVRYDFQTDSWTTLSSLPALRLAPTDPLPFGNYSGPLMMRPADGNLYVIDGWAGGHPPSGLIWKYDVAADSWSTLPARDPDPCEEVASWIDPTTDVLWVVGGDNENEETASSYVRDYIRSYDFGTGVWTVHGRTALPQSGACGWYDPSSGDGVVVGGWNDDDSVYSATRVHYDPTVAGEGDVWLRYTPAASGPVTLSAELNVPQQMVEAEVFTGSAVNAVSRVAQGAGIQDMLTFEGVAGTPYYVRVHSADPRVDTKVTFFGTPIPPTAATLRATALLMASTPPVDLLPDPITVTFTLDAVAQAAPPPITVPPNVGGSGLPPLADPTSAPTLTAVPGGTLAAGTYDYCYEAWQVSNVHRTAASPSASITVTANKGVSVSLPDVAGATGYTIYRRAGGGSWVRVGEVSA